MRFAVVSDVLWVAIVIVFFVSIRFEVRGGFRPGRRGGAAGRRVSIRFEVRGGFRLRVAQRLQRRLAFQSALRFAVVSDETIFATQAVQAAVSIRFEVRGGFRQPGC